MCHICDFYPVTCTLFIGALNISMHSLYISYHGLFLLQTINSTCNIHEANFAYKIVQISEMFSIVYVMCRLKILCIWQLINVMLLISYNKLFNQFTVKRIICVMKVLKLKQLKAATTNSGSILHYVTIGTIIS